MARPFPDDDFEQQLKGLFDELFSANVHFQIARGLQKNWREYYGELVRAHVFWVYTIHAHDTVAVVRLCRIYDLTKSGETSGLTLPRLIATVQADPKVFDKPDFRDRIEEDLEFC